MSSAIISAAIAGRKILQFDYDGGTRLVEPHQLGLNKAGHEALSAYWVGGFSASKNTPRWREYLVAKMSNISATTDKFDGPRPGYKAAPNGTFPGGVTAQL